VKHPVSSPVICVCDLPATFTSCTARVPQSRPFSRTRSMRLPRLIPHIAGGTRWRRTIYRVFFCFPSLPGAGHLNHMEALGTDRLKGQAARFNLRPPRCKSRRIIPLIALCHRAVCSE